MTADAVVTSLVTGNTVMPDLKLFTPLAPGPEMASSAVVPERDVPESLDDLPHQISRTYDLSVSAAGKLNIPVVGSVSGGQNRRVVVLERAAFDVVEDGDSAEEHWGYAIRLGVTISERSLETKLTLPFLAASAEIGRLEAKWVMQVVGLAGEEIDRAQIVPTELNVETFVLAKQSLQGLIEAVRHPSTHFRPTRIAVVRSETDLRAGYVTAVAKAFAVGRIEKGRTLRDALRELDSPTSTMRQGVIDAYRDFGGLSIADEEPSAATRLEAREILDDVDVRPR